MQLLILSANSNFSGVANFSNLIFEKTTNMDNWHNLQET